MNASADVLDRPVDATAGNTRPRFSGPQRPLNRRSRRAKSRRCKGGSTTTRRTRGKSGLFLNNRHYDPATGTFLSVDPLVAKTMQPYIYGAANPVTYSDPDGLDPDTASWIRERAEEEAGDHPSPEGSGPKSTNNGCTYSSSRWGCDSRTDPFAPPRLEYTNPTRCWYECGGGEGHVDKFFAHTIFDEMIARMLEAARLRASGADSRPGQPRAVPPSLEPLLEDEFIQGLECVTGLYVTGVAGQGATTGAGQWLITRGGSVGTRAAGNAAAGGGPSILACYHTD